MLPLRLLLLQLPCTTLSLTLWWHSLFVLSIGAYEECMQRKENVVSHMQCQQYKVALQTNTGPALRVLCLLH
jgi:hypothetical protein